MPQTHILIVDNQILTHTILASYLKHLGSNTIDYTHSVDSAVKLIKKKIPDLLIINNDLNKKSGAQLIHQLIRNQTVPIKVILYSNEVDQEFLMLARAKINFTCIFGEIELEQMVKQVMTDLQFIDNFKN